jgi:hypothetical protein
MDHDYAAQIYFNHHKMAYDAGLAEKILKSKNIVALNKASYDAIFNHRYANISTKTSEIYCEKPGLNSVFSDCATNREHQDDPNFSYEINSDDRLTADAFLAANLDSAKAVAPESASGLFLRNSFMLNHICAQATGKDSQIIILRCGAGHVFGSSNFLPFEQSLAGLAQEKRLTSVGFIPDLAFDSSAGEEVLDKINQGGSVFSRLPVVKAFNDDDDRHIHHAEVDKDEELYCAEILSRLNMSEHFLTADDISAHQRDAYKDMKRAYKKLASRLNL